jgi:hypothetical protein
MNEACMQVCMLINWPICFGSVNKVLRVINERLCTDYEAHEVDVALQ